MAGFRLCISPAFQPVVVGNHILTFFCRFIQSFSKGYGQANLGQAAVEFLCVQIIVGRIDAVDEYRAYLAGIHSINESNKFLVITLLVIGGRAPADGIAIGADSVIDSVHNDLYIDVIAAAHYQAVIL